VTAGEVLCPVRAERYAGRSQALCGTAIVDGIVDCRRRSFPAVPARLTVLTGANSFSIAVRRFANTSTVWAMSQIASVAVSDVVKKLLPVYHHRTMP